jgi:hypothetical protein
METMTKRMMFLWSRCQFRQGRFQNQTRTRRRMVQGQILTKPLELVVELKVILKARSYLELTK